MSRCCNSRPDHTHGINTFVATAVGIVGTRELADERYALGVSGHCSDVGGSKGQSDEEGRLEELHVEGGGWNVVGV